MTQKILNSNNGLLYFFEDNSREDLVVGEKEEVVIFELGTRSYSRNINVCNNSKIIYNSILSGNNDFLINIDIGGDRSSVEINMLNLSNDRNLSLRISGKINSMNSKLKINILSLVKQNGILNVDSSITVEQNSIEAIGDIFQENIFLGSGGKINGKPSLFINTDDAKASHALKIEKINDADIFYLESRGIDKTEATTIMLQSKLGALFLSLDNEGNILAEKIFNEFIKN